MKEEVYNSDLHFEHQQWKSELAFWEDELKLFKNKWDELASRKKEKEVLAQLDHFQNIFMLHGKVIEDLQENIEEHETNIADHNNKGYESTDIGTIDKHLELRHKMETQRQVYADLKKEFFGFLTKYL